MINSVSLIGSISSGEYLEERTKKWRDHDRELRIDLSLKHGELTCLISNLAKGITRGISLEGYFNGPVLLSSNKAKFEFLSERDPVFTNDENFVFRLPCLRRIKLSENIEVCLAQGKQDLIWEVFDRSTCSLRWTFVPHQVCTVNVTPHLDEQELYSHMKKVVQSDQIYLLPTDSVALRSLLDSRLLRGISMESRINYIRDFTVDRIEHNSHAELVAVKIKKIAFPCMFDATISIDCDRYAVTLLRRQQCESKTSQGLFTPEHAEIFVEGVKKGVYFIQKSHLTPEGVKSLYIDTNSDDETWRLFREKLLKKYGEVKVKTWQSARDKVQRMLVRIEWEVQMQNAGYTPVLFGYSGRYSLHTVVFRGWQTRRSLNWNEEQDKPIDPSKSYIPHWGKPDNCTSWAIARLNLADITELSTGVLGLIAQVPNYLAADFRSIGFE